MTRKRNPRILWLPLLLLLAASSAGAQSSDRLKGLLSDPSARAAAAEAGKKASFFCANCHGVDGNSKLPEVPNLRSEEHTSELQSH